MQVIEKLIKSDLAPNDRGVVWFNTLDNHFYIFDSKDGWIDYIEKAKPVVDDALSEDSLNALQNKVLTEIIGGTSLDALETASKNFIGAINELLGVLDSKVSQQEMNTAIDESLGEIQDALENLPDGQAVSAQVVLNTAAIEVLQEEVSQLGQKLIKLKGISYDYESTGATNVGDILFNTKLGVLRKMTAFNPPAWEVIPFESGAIYSCNGKLYVYNGETLVLADESLALGVGGFLENIMYPGFLDSSNKIVEYNPAQYRVLKVNGGETFKLTSESQIGIFVLSSFTYSPTLPYTPTFATGETGRRISTSHDFTLPSDARYVLVQAENYYGTVYTYTSFEVGGIDILHTLPEQVKSINSRLTTEEGKTAVLEGKLSTDENNIANLQKKDSYVKAVKDLGDWVCRFNGTSSKAVLKTPIVLSSNGDSIEVEINNVMPNNSDTRATAFASGGTSSLFWIYKTTVQLRFEGESSNHTVYSSGATITKVKIARTASAIEVYLNGSSTASASFTAANLQIDVFGNRSTYWWKGDILSVKVNGYAYYLQENATLTDVVVSRDNGFLTDEQAQKVNGLMSPIVVRPSSSSKFYLDVLDSKTGKYLTHVFILQNYTKEETYGNSQTKEVLCGNVWYDADIYDTPFERSGHYVVQGNSNFIYRIDNTVPGFENENGHVGAYHGGAIMEWTQFIADGVVIDPTSLSAPLNCNTFRFIEKVNHYAIDTTQEGFVYNGATLKLDENGEPILAAVQFFDSEYRVDNYIKFRNKLTIKRDNTRFYQCFSAMLEGYGGFFDKVVVNNAEQTFNQWVFPGGGAAVTITKLGNSQIDLSASPYQFADTVELFGKDYFVKQTMMQFVNSRYDKSNIHTVFYSDNPRLKTYQMPCICTISASTLGETAESFNTGDFLEVLVERKIELNLE